MRPAGVLGDISADTAGHLTRRIRRIVQPVRSSSLRDVEIDDAWLNHCKAVLNVDSKDAIHSLKFDENSAFGSKCSAAQPRPGAARQKRDSVFIRDADDLSHLLGCRRKHDDVRFVLEERKTIAFVNEQLGFVFHDRCRFEAILETWRLPHRSVSKKASPCPCRYEHPRNRGGFPGLS